MVQIIGIVVIIAVVGAAAWVMLGGAQAAIGAAPLLWMVEPRAGKVVRFEGAFPPVGWRDVHDIAMAGELTGVVSYRGDGTVRFTGDVSESDQQRIRNALVRGPGGSCIPGPKG